VGFWNAFTVFAVTVVAFVCIFSFSLRKMGIPEAPANPTISY
jgi:hypothetical protein